MCYVKLETGISKEAVMGKYVLALIALLALSMAAAACREEVVKEVAVEKVVTQEVVKEIPVEVVVTKEIIKEVRVPGETVVVEREVVKTVEVPVEKLVTQEVIREIPVEVVVTKEVIKEVRVPGETVVVTKEIEVIKEVEVATFARFGEAPGLKQLTQAGLLPPVEQRIPKQPMVIATQEIGRYGGDYRGYLTSPDNGWTMQLTNKTGMLRYSTDGNVIIPHVARKWDVSEDGKVYTFWLREGMKWSDGAPFTADDFMFQYSDIILDDRLTIPTEKRGGALLGEIAKVNDYTITMSFDQPNYLFPQTLTQLDTPGFIVPGWQSGIPFSPGHYLRQWLPKYADGGEASLANMAMEEGLATWMDLFIEKFSTLVNADRPTVRPWALETSIRARQYRGARNPFFFGVDPAGNQLPYIDRLIYDLVTDPGVISLKALSGEYSTYGVPSADLGAFMENRERGNFDIYHWTPLSGTDSGLYFNMSWQGPEKEYINDRDFRIALSIAIDRGEINEITFAGRGEARNGVPPAGHPYYPGGQYAYLHTEYDPERANEILDGIVPNKDGDGWRLMANGDRLQMIFTTPPGTQINDVMEQVATYWQAVGVWTKNDQISRSGASTRAQANEAMMCSGGNGTAPFVFSAPQKTAPVMLSGCENIGPEYIRWFQTKGEQGIEPPEDIQRLQRLATDGKNMPVEQGNEMAKEIFRMHAENQWIIGIVGLVPGNLMVSNNLRNVPRTATSAWPIRSPSNAFPEQWFFSN